MAKIMGKIGKRYASVKAADTVRPQLIPTYQSDQPIYKDWDTARANRFGLQASTVVYACVRKLSLSAASVPWHVEKLGKKDRWERIPDHPAELLIKSPNPYMTSQDMFERLTYHLNLGGNGIWYPVKLDNIPVELWPLQPQHVTPIPHATKFLSGYKYQVNGGEERVLDVDDVIHFQFVNPSDPYWGMSPLQAAAKVVDSDVEAVNWNKVSLQRRGVPDGVFAVNAPGSTRQQWLEARQQVRDQYLGKGREPWVVFNVDYKQMSLTPIEMDFLETRKFNREEICSVYGVLPIMIGAMDGTSYNNITTAKRIFWEDTIIPYLDDIRDCLNTSLLPFFEKGHTGRADIRINYDISNVPALQENMAKKAATAKVYFDMGIPVKQINERLELGFDDEKLPDVAQAQNGPRGEGEDENTRGQGTKPPKDPDKNPNKALEKVSDLTAVRMEKCAGAVIAAFEEGGKVAALRAVSAEREHWKEFLDTVNDVISEKMGLEPLDSDTMALQLCRALALKVASDFETAREARLFFELKSRDLARRFVEIQWRGNE